jgi:hypothetical protein
MVPSQVGSLDVIRIYQARIVCLVDSVVLPAGSTCGSRCSGMVVSLSSMWFFQLDPHVDPGVPEWLYHYPPSKAPLRWEIL